MIGVATANLKDSSAKYENQNNMYITANGILFSDGAKQKLKF
jgi:hypothetical protein